MKERGAEAVTTTRSAEPVGGLAPADAAAPAPPRFWATWRGALVLAAFAVAMLLFMGRMNAWLLATEAASLGQATNLRQGGDSYVYWFALHALRDGRDPYSPDVTGAIQVAILGVSEPERLVHPAWQAFVYPLPVLLWYLPMLGLSLEAAAQYGRLLGVAALPACVLLGLRLARLPLTGWPAIAAAALLTGMAGVHEQFALAQNTTLFLALALAAALLYAQGRYALASAVLMLALLKPQQVLVLALGLGLHALADRRRWGFFLGLALAGAGSLALSLLVAPGWLTHWLDNLGRYSRYNLDYLQALLGGNALAVWLVRAGLVLPVLGLWWRRRRHDAGPWLVAAVAAALVAGLLAFSNVVAYNLLLLWPALLLIVLSPETRPVGFTGRLALALNVALLVLIGTAAGLIALAWTLAGPGADADLGPLGELVGRTASLQAFMVALWMAERFLPTSVRTRRL